MVGQEIEKLKKNGHIESATNINENCFISPAVITVKKDKTAKIAVDSRKLKEINVKREAKMPNMEKLIIWISRKIAHGATDQIWVSKYYLDYAYGQLVIKTRNGPLHICNNRRQFHRILKIREGVLWFGGHSDHISRKD